MFHELPTDLKNVVCDFAYCTPWDLVRKDLEMCAELQEMDISPVFTRKGMWSTFYKEYLPSPLVKFEPIRHFGEWRDYIDWNAVQEFLWRLDFRRRFVRTISTRDGWRARLKKNWRDIKIFDDFFRFLLYTRVPCFKPIWKPVGFHAIKSYRSPMYSADWWLQF